MFTLLPPPLLRQSCRSSGWGAWARPTPSEAAVAQQPATGETEHTANPDFKPRAEQLALAKACLVCEQTTLSVAPAALTRPSRWRATPVLARRNDCAVRSPTADARAAVKGRPKLPSCCADKTDPTPPTSLGSMKSTTRQHSLLLRPPTAAAAPSVPTAAAGAVSGVGGLVLCRNACTASRLCWMPGMES